MAQGRAQGAPAGVAVLTRDAGARCGNGMLRRTARVCGLRAGARADGSFESSDSLVNLIWRSSVRTARDMVSPPVNLDRRGCDIGVSTVLLDGAQRDRCPYIGDQAVTGMTLLVSQDDVRVLRDMIAWFASVQNADGSIPASALHGHRSCSSTTTPTGSSASTTTCSTPATSPCCRGSGRTW